MPDHVLAEFDRIFAALEKPAEVQRQGWQAILDNYAAYLRENRT